MNFRKQIGTELQRSREKQKLSKREVALAMGATPQRYGEWEEGEGNIGAESIEKAAIALKRKPVFKLKK